MLESESYAGTLPESHICGKFLANPRNMQCSNGTEIDWREGLAT